MLAPCYIYLADVDCDQAVLLNILMSTAPYSSKIQSCQECPTFLPGCITSFFLELFGIEQGKHLYAVMTIDILMTICLGKVLHATSLQIIVEMSGRSHSLFLSQTPIVIRK